ncbi:MAG: hypothetical protein M1820_010388 [Bogoriella megaspora]|nr:MAG: hypothetical protein M1820_010388 [Bogoriella megaspora]
MARIDTSPGATTQAPDPTAINLTRLLSRLEQTLLSPDAEEHFGRSSYERTRVGANLEYARTLLLRLEHDSTGPKIQSRRQELQVDLQNKRDRIKRLNQRLNELNQLGATAEEDSSSSDSEDDSEQDEHTTTPSYAPAQPASSSIDTSSPPSTLRSRRPPAPSPNPPSTGTTTSTSLFNARPKSPSSTTAPSAQTTTLLEHHASEQESLTSSLIALASSLKASTQQFSASLEAEKSVLDRAGEGLDKNVEGMEGAQKRMGVLRRMTEGKGWWGRMVLYAWIAGLWVAVFLVGFVGPKIRF